MGSLSSSSICLHRPLSLSPPSSLKNSRNPKRFLKISQDLRKGPKIARTGFKEIGGPVGRRHVAVTVTAGIQVDRRRHLEESFRRQEERDLRAAEAEVSCPVDCVREILTLPDFERELREAEACNELVVVDFYNSSCGACKYILPKFIKLCKKGCGEECEVEGKEGEIRFLKHNVRDDYDDLTDVARFYKIKVVPMFTFFMDGCRVEQFPTRDQKKLTATIGRLLHRYHEVAEKDKNY